MQVHLTAAAVQSALAKRRTANALDALADLDEREHEAVADALATVKSSARVDVRVLVATVRAQLRRRDEAEAERRQVDGGAALSAMRYQITLATRDELEHMRDRLRAAADRGEERVPWPFPPGSNHAAFAARIDAIAANLRPDDVEPDPDPDDDEPARPRRRRIPPPSARGSR